jgi:hypothetical protein
MFEASNRKELWGKKSMAGKAEWIEKCVGKKSL